MDIFKWFRNKKQITKIHPIKGWISYFELEKWWLSEFTEQEREYITSKFQPMGNPHITLITGDIKYTDETVSKFLNTLSTWFSSSNDRYIAKKILRKSMDTNAIDTSILDTHFSLSTLVTLYYKDRSNPESLEKAVDACRKQIAIAPEAALAFKDKYINSPLPSHLGYKQLAIILEKKSELKNAIELCEKAMTEGWTGDWNKRIERCKKKLDKQLN